jgi:opacity protein-like surface antigen
MRKLNYLLLAILGFSPLLLSAQKFSIGLLAGVATYQGDVTEKYSTQGISENKPTFGGFVKYHFKDNLSVRANYLQGVISGDENIYRNTPWRIQRGFSFKSPITEIATMVEWDALNWHFGNNGYAQGQKLSLYVMGGVGFVKTNPVVDFNEPNPMYEDVNIDKLAQYSRNHIVIPMGVGIKWRITPNQTLSLEAANRLTFTDYLDGISKTAQPKYGDWYLIGMISFSQTLSWEGGSSFSRKRGYNASVSCPKFK